MPAQTAGCLSRKRDQGKTWKIPDIVTLRQHLLFILLELSKSAGRTEANDLLKVTIVPLSSVRGRAAYRLVQPLLSAKETHLPKNWRALLRPGQNHRQRTYPRNRRWRIPKEGRSV